MRLLFVMYGLIYVRLVIVSRCAFSQRYHAFSQGTKKWKR